MLLHDDQGHPLLATTHRADQHLIVGLPSVIARYEDSKEHAQVKRIIVDREGMATEFLVRLHAEGRTVITILQTTQYQDLTSFCDVGTFVPLRTDAQGQVIREVAPARIILPRSFDADRERNDLRWWEEGWQATAAPAKEMTAKLIPIVTTAQTIDAIELAQTYIHRWPVAEKM